MAWRKEKKPVLIHSITAADFFFFCTFVFLTYAIMTLWYTRSQMTSEYWTSERGEGRSD